MPEALSSAPGWTAGGGVGIQRAAAAHSQVVVVRPDGDVGRRGAAVVGGKDPDHVRSAATLPLERHREGGEPGKREGARVHVAPIEGLLNLRERVPATREEPVAGRPVNGDREDALTARGRDVEGVGRELARPLGLRAGDHHHARGAPVAGRRRLGPEVGVPVQHRPRLLLHVVGEVAEHDHHPVAHVVARVAVVLDTGALRQADPVAREEQIAPDLPGLGEGERPDLIAAEALVPPGAQRGPEVLHPRDEAEGDSEALMPGERPRSRCPPVLR